MFLMTSFMPKWTNSVLEYGYHIRNNRINYMFLLKIIICFSFDRRGLKTRNIMIQSLGNHSKQFTYEM